MPLQELVKMKVHKYYWCKSRGKEPCFVVAGVGADLKLAAIQAQGKSPKPKGSCSWSSFENTLLKCRRRESKADKCWCRIPKQETSFWNCGCKHPKQGSCESCWCRIPKHSRLVLERLVWELKGWKAKKVVGVGAEGFELEVGPWNCLANKAMAVDNYVPDFDAVGIAPLRALRIRRPAFLAAMEATSLQPVTAFPVWLIPLVIPMSQKHTFDFW